MACRPLATVSAALSDSGISCFSASGVISVSWLATFRVSSVLPDILVCFYHSWRDLIRCIHSFLRMSTDNCEWCRHTLAVSPGELVILRYLQALFNASQRFRTTGNGCRPHQRNHRLSLPPERWFQKGLPGFCPGSGCRICRTLPRSPPRTRNLTGVPC